MLKLSLRKKVVDVAWTLPKCIGILYYNLRIVVLIVQYFEVLHYFASPCNHTLLHYSMSTRFYARFGRSAKPMLLVTLLWSSIIAWHSECLIKSHSLEVRVLYLLPNEIDSTYDLQGFWNLWSIDMFLWLKRYSFKYWWVSVLLNRDCPILSQATL